MYQIDFSHIGREDSRATGWAAATHLGKALERQSFCAVTVTNGDVFSLPQQYPQHNRRVALATRGVGKSFVLQYPFGETYTVSDHKAEAYMGRMRRAPNDRVFNIVD